MNSNVLFVWIVCFGSENLVLWIFFVSQSWKNLLMRLFYFYHDDGSESRNFLKRRIYVFLGKMLITYMINHSLRFGLILITIHKSILFANEVHCHFTLPLQEWIKLTEQKKHFKSKESRFDIALFMCNSFFVRKNKEEKNMTQCRKHKLQT